MNTPFSFLAALDIRNNKLIFSSYIGGNSTDDGEALVLSENGFLYYVGDTWSENFPTTEGAFQTTYGGVGEGVSGGDMFIMKIDTSNWKLIYSTLLGGEFDEGVRALAVDEYENAWVVGMSQSGLNCYTVHTMVETQVNLQWALHSLIKDLSCNSEHVPMIYL